MTMAPSIDFTQLFNGWSWGNEAALPDQLDAVILSLPLGSVRKPRACKLISFDRDFSNSSEVTFKLNINLVLPTSKSILIVTNDIAYRLYNVHYIALNVYGAILA